MAAAARCRPPAPPWSGCAATRPGRPRADRAARPPAQCSTAARRYPRGVRACPARARRDTARAGPAARRAPAAPVTASQPGPSACKTRPPGPAGGGQPRSQAAPNAMTPATSTGVASRGATPTAASRRLARAAAGRGRLARRLVMRSPGRAGPLSRRLRARSSAGRQDGPGRQPADLHPPGQAAELRPGPQHGAQRDGRADFQDAGVPGRLPGQPGLRSRGSVGPRCGPAVRA